MSLSHSDKGNSTRHGPKARRMNFHHGWKNGRGVVDCGLCTAPTFLSRTFPKCFWALSFKWEISAVEHWKSRDVQTCFGLCRLGGVLEIHNHVMLKSPLDSVALAAGSLFSITFLPTCSGHPCPDGMLDVCNHVPTFG